MILPAAAANFQPQIMRLPEITDPVAGYRIILDPVHQIAHRVAIQARQNQAPNLNAGSCSAWPSTRSRREPGTTAPP